jgi:hypothetical protein
MFQVSGKKLNNFFYHLLICFLPDGGVAEVRERLLSDSEAGIAAYFRRKG